MADTHELAREVLRDAFLMTLAIADADGPWAASVIFVADDDFNLYWLSKPTARHSRAIEVSGKAAVAITASWNLDDERALQIEGKAERVENPPQTAIDALSEKRGKPEPQSAAEELEKDLVWYRFIPSRIELFYTKHFDYDRQRVL